ncbi:MAG TPA: molybdopterin molybdenumtransferase MoeA, partial [Nitrospiraceae bacterium]|nr:molybdopterin molybdenumtransferase MoeA [Nitrospiraceae bacterium]
MLMEAISFKKALEITINNIQPLPTDYITIERLVGRVAAEDIFSLVDSPSHDVSLKDGYAVKFEDIEMASEESPVYLRLKGSLMAGSSARMEIIQGHAVKIMSGAVIPHGTEAVISNEFASDDGVSVRVVNNAMPGQNILPSGTDTKKDELIVEKGARLRPTQVGLIAAAGHSSLKAYITPRVTIIATGDEVLAVGMPFQKGKVFASNLITISAWCSFYGMQSNTVIVKDEGDAIKDV